MPTSPSPRHCVTDRVDLIGLADGLAALDAATDFDGAQVALKSIAIAIAMPLLAWAPDVSRPAFDPRMHAFFRREGWPDEVLELWWDRTIMLKSPLYIRCRTGALPFVTSPSDKVPDRSLELRRIGTAIERLGATAMITMPIHLPRGLVAMVTWGGAMTKAEARAVLSATRPALLAAGHLFMHAYLAEGAGLQSSDEELARFTPREWECLRLTAQGLREEQVANTLGLGGTTVRYHLDNVVRKLGATNRVHAVALAAQLGLLGSIG